eukprot:scaffold2408_cov386-Prasinococcus_capsulatus_cf.AAC.4
MGCTGRQGATRRRHARSRGLGSRVAQPAEVACPGTRRQEEHPRVHGGPRRLPEERTRELPSLVASRSVCGADRPSGAEAVALGGGRTSAPFPLFRVRCDSKLFR